MKCSVLVRFAVAVALATTSFPSTTLGERTPVDDVERLVDVGGYRLSCRVYGRGTPTVVFLSGFKAPQTYWGDIPHRAGTRTLAITYDRAGVGNSDQAPPPRHAARVAQELRTLLRELSAPPPYVVVGHSFGSVHAHMFAAMYPDLVAGLILLDPGHKDLMESFSNQLTGAERERWDESWMEVWARYNGGTDSLGHEMQSVDESLRLQREVVLDEDLPLIVVSALDPSRASPIVASLTEESQRAYFAFLREYHEQLAASTRLGRRVTAEGSGHMIPIERPGLVADLIDEMLDTLVAPPATE